MRDLSDFHIIWVTQVSLLPTRSLDISVKTAAVFGVIISSHVICHVTPYLFVVPSNRRCYKASNKRGRKG
jgi:hypothetical protein